MYKRPKPYEILRDIILFCDEYDILYYTPDWEQDSAKFEDIKELLVYDADERHVAYIRCDSTALRSNIIAEVTTFARDGSEKQKLRFKNKDRLLTFLRKFFEIDKRKKYKKKQVSNTELLNNVI